MTEATRISGRAAYRTPTIIAADGGLTWPPSADRLIAGEASPPPFPRSDNPAQLYQPEAPMLPTQKHLAAFARVRNRTAEMTTMLLAKEPLLKTFPAAELEAMMRRNIDALFSTWLHALPESHIQTDTRRTGSPADGTQR